MRIRTFMRGALAVLAAAIVSSHPDAQQAQRFLYAALPGVGGGNNLTYGGAGILVFDIDHGHKFVKRIPLQGAPPPARTSAAQRTRSAWQPQEAIKGIAAHAQTARLYVSTSRRVAAYDLLTDKLVWEQSYDGARHRPHRALTRRADALRAGARRAEMDRRRRRNRRANHDRSTSRAIRTTRNIPTMAGSCTSRRKATRGRCRWSTRRRGRS